MKGDKLIFTQSNSVYRNKVGSRPTAEEIITTDEVKTAVHSGKSIEDNGNRFIGHSVAADSFKQARRSMVDIMRTDTVASASHNIYAYRFTSQDGSIHESSDDDGEHGAEAMTDNEITNALVVVSRWFGGMIGPRRFTHIKEAGLSVVKSMVASTKG